MLKVSHIKKSFDEQIILRDVSFEAHRGKLTILEGQNGAGKSTLFNLLVGILSPDQGKIYLGDKDLSKLSALERSRDIAILKQDPKASSLPSMSLWENCAFALLKNKNSNFKNALSIETKTQIINHLEQLQIDYKQLLDKPLGKLSGGQRQILAFAMATCNRPQLLLLDEPSAALDDRSSQQLMKLVKKLISAWDIPALMISHDHALNQSYGDAIILLKDGVCLSI